MKYSTGDTAHYSKGRYTIPVTIMKLGKPNGRRENQVLVKNTDLTEYINSWVHVSALKETATVAMSGNTTIEALMDASHHVMEIDDGTQFKVFDRVEHGMRELCGTGKEINALENLIDIIVAELKIALSENKG